MAARIGGVLVDNASGEVLGEGHNGLVQEGNPILHGEMATLRDAGRMRNRHGTTMYTTLQPCFMCTGAITQFGIPRVVIGDVTNASSDETIRFLRSRGIEVIVMDPASGTRSVPELRRIAGQHLDRRQTCQTLESAALANEAYLKLVRAGGIRCENRVHFLASALFANHPAHSR